MKNFRNIQVEESNLLSWQGLIVPVSMCSLFDCSDIFWPAVVLKKSLLLTSRITLPTTKVHSGLKSFFPLSTLSSPPRSHSRQKSITPTLMRRARCACLWSAQRTGSQPPKLTKVGVLVLALHGASGDALRLLNHFLVWLHIICQCFYIEQGWRFKKKDKHADIFFFLPIPKLAILNTISYILYHN